MSESRDRYVYVYEDIAGTPFYIGVGKGNRMWHHIRRAHYDLSNGRSVEKAAFIVRNIQRGGPPDPYKVAENLTIAEAMELEVQLIKQIGRRDLGTGPLFNKSAGGFGIKDPSENTKRKQSESQKARWTPELKLAWSDSRKALMTPEMRAIISEKMRNFCASPDAKQSRSAGASLRWANPSARAQHAMQFVGRPVSAETREIIGAKAKARMANPDRRREQSLLTASQMSKPEARMHLREAAASQWADPEKRAKKIAGLKAAWVRRKKLTSEVGAPA